MAEIEAQGKLPIDSLFAFKRPYLDSSVFFAIVKKEAIPAHGGLMRWEIAKRILDDAKAGKYTIFTSVITLAEVRRIKGKNEQLTDEEREEIKAFFEHEWIMPLEVNREIGEKAQDLGAIYGINPMDALHLASAIFWECDVLMAWDPAFTAKFVGTQIEGVTVREPYWEGIINMNTTAEQAADNC